MRGIYLVCQALPCVSVIEAECVVYAVGYHFQSYGFLIGAEGDRGKHVAAFAAYEVQSHTSHAHGKEVLRAIVLEYHQSGECFLVARVEPDLCGGFEFVVLYAASEV